MSNYRPYTTYKAFGGVLTAMSLPIVLGYFIWGTPTTPRPSLLAASIALVFGSMGVWIFVASDRQIKIMKNAEPISTVKRPGIRVDRRGIVIFAGAMLLFLLFVAIRARQGG